jgi:hypothetical protein
MYIRMYVCVCIYTSALCVLNILQNTEHNPNYFYKNFLVWEFGII